MAIAYCRIPTPAEKKEMERQEQLRKQKRSQESKAVTRQKPVSRFNKESKVWKTYAEMTPAEKRKIDEITRKVNGQIRQRLGIKSDLAGIEYR